MLNPRPPASVVAGNVETSTCITNALYGALGVMAAAQCTMNNFTFGNARHQYYETISGGSGAGPGFDGTSVVQTHMTNSRLTDPEVLEFRFPVLVEEFRIRRGSGGAGLQHGGDGVVRRVRFREAMTPADRLEAMDLDDVLHARVGDVIASLRVSGRQHALVIDSAARSTVVSRYL